MATTSCIKMTACFLQAALIVLCIGAPAHAQSNTDKRPATPSGELSIHYVKSYQRWLDEDVHWIITDEERAAFLRLSKDEDRDRFIEAFWLRRDPTPGTVENEFKEEHYRRIAYANVHFAHELPGWKTDRGRAYIVFGPPDEVKTDSARRSDDAANPTELWHYRSIRPSNPDSSCESESKSLATAFSALQTCLRMSQGHALDLKFVDVCRCGDYRLGTP